MPHVVVKLWPGKSEQQKLRSVVEILHYAEESISVAMVEVRPREWAEKVYQREIENNLGELYKKPGYSVNDLPK